MYCPNVLRHWSHYRPFSINQVTTRSMLVCFTADIGIISHGLSVIYSRFNSLIKSDSDKCGVKSILFERIRRGVVASWRSSRRRCNSLRAVAIFSVAKESTTKMITSQPLVYLPHSPRYCSCP